VSCSGFLVGETPSLQKSFASSVLHSVWHAGLVAKADPGGSRLASEMLRTFLPQRLSLSLSLSLSSFPRLCARIKRFALDLMAASVPSSGSLITHLVSRIESDLTFLASHNLVTAPELQQIRSTLAEAQVRANGAALELLALRNDPAAANHNAAGPGLMPAVPAQQQRVAPPKPQCKAVWDYTKSQVST
jgi:hypothetical protein